MHLPWKIKYLHHFLSLICGYRVCENLFSVFIICQHQQNAEFSALFTFLPIDRAAGQRSLARGNNKKIKRNSRQLPKAGADCGSWIADKEIYTISPSNIIFCSPLSECVCVSAVQKTHTHREYRKTHNKVHPNSYRKQAEELRRGGAGEKCVDNSTEKVH